ncbi:DUF898 family protein [Caballeronia sp. LZ019]|uniref:YjgN family protein n=1 Tax=Caballeronia sp. LZ019 TaxID=3038555 RepID=UPI00286021B3|nr:DUF898 family protein [Caballeronia sp. LZ019]MDR5808113.1 DUF898 family protein [Caballeronia sp. LZ019]
MSTPNEMRPALTYDGDLGDMYAVYFKNLLSSIITLGIYRFWGVTNMRRYVWSHVRFQDERFEYTGTGGELLRGFLLAGAVLVGASVAALIVGGVLKAATGSAVVASLPVFVLYVVVFVLALGAYYSAERYRLSRTVWRGIRGGMTGSAFAYGLKSLLYALLCVVTLYQLVPWVTMRLLESRINASSFGDQSFSFQGQAGKVYGAFLIALLGSLALAAALGLLIVWPVATFIQQSHDSLGGLYLAVLAGIFMGGVVLVLFIIGSWVMSCFYFASLSRHVAANTTFGALRFESRVTAFRVMRLVLGNLAILAVTAGLGYPIALHRGLRFAATTLFVAGEIDPAALHQTTLRAPAAGEGMLNALDHGAVL